MSHETFETAEKSMAAERTSWLQRRFERLLHEAGIVINGPNPWDPRIHNQRALRRMALEGTLGAGEAYVDGDWDCPSLDVLAMRVLGSDLDEHWAVFPEFSLKRFLEPLVNFQSRAFGARNVKAHYDLGNELYKAMLGPTMAYSCGYWRQAKTLDDAQSAKHELICRKLALQPGMRVLDIGCGWGGFAKYAAERYGVRVVGVTLSAAQAKYAENSCADLPVEIRLQDYRDVRGSFERIVSIGMFEHVGPRNYRNYFESVRSNLTWDGLFLLHTIGSLRSLRRLDPWMGRHIFPHAVLPSGSQIQQTSEGLLVLEDWHNLGADYDKTLMAWHANFVSAWSSLRQRYDERFYRMWGYYLLTCAGSFRARSSQLWQIVFSKHGVPGGYVRTGT
ncbi:MAG: cyclopropane fatty acyl phospholipid synthase [Candidatus Acidiferrum sp.]